MSEVKLQSLSTANQILAEFIPILKFFIKKNQLLTKFHLDLVKLMAVQEQR